MTLVIADPLFEEHQTGDHPESAKRLHAVRHALKHPPTPSPESSAETDRWIDETHTYRNLISRIAEEGGGRLDADTVCSPRSYRVAHAAVASAMHAVDQVITGQVTNAACLVRPPGHHATPSESMGFCLFNNIAVAAKYALSHHQMNRVLIVDWDVHHGNGTQDTFYDDERVTFLSLHRSPFYPGTGSQSETGTKAGLGHTINVPLAADTSERAYLEHFRRSLEHAAKTSNPELILISAGFDAHQHDPIGGLNLSESAFGEMTRDVLDVAKMYAGERVISLLEGGYHPQALARCVNTHLQVLRGDKDD